MTEDNKIQMTDDITIVEKKEEETAPKKPLTPSRQKKVNARNKVLTNTYTYTSAASDQMLRSFATKAIQGKLTSAEWSRMTPSFRKQLERFVKKMKKAMKSPEFVEAIKNLPDDAIVKDINLDNDSTDTVEEK